ncbi:MAG TPA: glycosyltransferase [Candidatus Acidoferrum sp.]|nr:glycosyltransferase [Candidatus Acidoferrum sp.]
MDWTLICATNDEQILRSCLLSSPDLPAARDVLLQRGFDGAAAAYNAAMDKARSDLLVFVHQDVYLPAGWLARVENAVGMISEKDPDWGVLGVWGVQTSGERAGLVYDGGWGRILGGQFDGGLEVESLDEMVLILRKSAGLNFDPRIAGFHMYGTDICLEAKRRGKKCYAIAALSIHNTNQYWMLPWQFWKGYWAMRKKWRAQLPVKTTCTDITRWCWPMIRWNVVRGVNLLTRRDSAPLKRVADPRHLYQELIASGKVAPIIA